MLSPNIEKALNEQMKLEAESSQFYLAMAGWAENKGYNGTADLMYRHSDEERSHMLIYCPCVGFLEAPVCTDAGLQFRSVEAYTETCTA